MPSHDSSYKQLFSHPRMVQELLCSFVHEPWVAQLDFSSLEKVSGSFVSDDLRDREDDVIWKVRIGESWIYLYILLEFQSTVDRFMAVRLLTYTGLLYQDLLKSGQIKGKQKLPPVFPLVLYNGHKRWHAATDLTHLVDRMPVGLEQYQPRYRYLVLDEGSYGATELEELRNLVAALFQLEHSRDPETLQRIVGCLADWLGADESETLRRSFIHWLKRVFLPERLPELDHESIEELVEVEIMLEQRVKQWKKEWKAEGLAEGKLEGKLEAKREIAKGLILQGVSLDIVAAATSLNRDELENLRR
ncbi:Rpn family recombination-promoting nuclease/putative transposase, partial [bacterium]|nr:Rpn family recombination-promoting nuclease/putative transposase [bacterium]